MKDPLRITTLTRIARSVRRWFTPSQWLMWMMALKKQAADFNSSGLVLIQIDGLSQAQLEQAVEQGRMPLLKGLLDRENYRLHTFISGLRPTASTMQGELCDAPLEAGPGSLFKSRGTGQQSQKGTNDIGTIPKGPLAGGSAYCSLLSGGAEEVHFPVNKPGVAQANSTGNSVKIIFFTMLKPGAWFRILGMVSRECWMAIRGVRLRQTKDHHFWREIRQIPSRVIHGVVMRELAVTGIAQDTYRGLPIIHATLWGYDEQVSRYGPGTHRAQNALTTIDCVVSRIWNTVHRSDTREYDLWIFYEPGQMPRPRLGVLTAESSLDNPQTTNASGSSQDDAPDEAAFDSTSGFCLLPVDALAHPFVEDPNPITFEPAVRTDMIRSSIQRFLGRPWDHPMDSAMLQSPTEKQACCPEENKTTGEPGGRAACTNAQPKICQLVSRPERPVGANSDPKLMTYNVHAGVGMDGRLSLERITRVIAQSASSIVCLQEVDVNRQRSNHVDQPGKIASDLKMNHLFLAARESNNEKFGNAILSSYPLTLVEKIALFRQKKNRSPRIAIWVSVDLPNGVSLQVINTHLSLYPAERKRQAAQLMETWIPRAMQKGPVAICGDFNSRPHSKTYNIFARNLHDTSTNSSAPIQATYFSTMPLLRLDHLFVSQELVTKNTCVLTSRLAKMASDHLPLVTELSVAIPDSLNTRLQAANDGPANSTPGPYKK